MTDPSLEKLMYANLLEVFGERDPERRMAAIRRTYTPDVVAADPDGEVVGYEALSAKAQSILDQSPDFVFQVDGTVYQVADALYLGWALGPEGAAPVVRGADFALVRDGRMSRLYTVIFSQ